MQILWFVITLTASMLLPVTAAAQSQGSPKELTEIRSRINVEQQRLGHAHAQRDKLLRALKRSETQAAVVNRRLGQIRQASSGKQQALDQLRSSRASQAANLQRLRAQLGIHLRSAYIAGRQDIVRALLGQSDPSKWARAQKYYEFITRARSDDITTTVDEIRSLLDIEDRIAAEANALETLRERALAAREELFAERGRRAHLVAEFAEQIRTATERLAKLRRDEQALGGLIEDISQENALGAIADVELTPFADLRGKLLWPTRGRVRHGFSPRPDPDNLHWQGVWITAPAGQPIHVVGDGRVAFADWIRGFGFVLIVEHGDGYMSLYGHARELWKEAGEWVRANDVIGAVGDTGGQRDSGLYFEIRKQGQPRNPTRWCAGTPATRQVQNSSG